MTQINLGNGAQTIYGYWGVGGTNDNPGGYYGRLWRIKTSKDGTDRQNITHTWDAGGNLTQRQDVVASETETFGYDFLDRLTSVSGAYSQSYTYDTIGNIATMNGQSYTYGSKPHAVTQVVGSTTTYYTYDANGNMTARGTQTIAWDVENKVSQVNTGTSTATFVYDGDGNRVKKTEGGQTVIYVNQYYEKNLTTGEVTKHYYLGGKEIAFRKGSSTYYVHQEHLGSTAVVTDGSGNVAGKITYQPFGATRTQTGSLYTDKKFTGQRLDSTGLYYCGARYYDPGLARFVSPDTIVPDWTNPQSLNRYSYCLNNPLKYTDPTGHQVILPPTEVILAWMAQNPDSDHLSAEGKVLAHALANALTAPPDPAASIVAPPMTVVGAMAAPAGAGVLRFGLEFVAPRLAAAGPVGWGILAVGVLGVGIWYIATHGGGDSGTGVDASAYNQWQYEQTGFASPVNASNSAVLAPSSVVQAMNADLAGHEASGWTYTVVGQEAWEHQERFNECIEWFDQCHTGDCGTCFGYCMAQGEWDFYNCPP